MKIGQIEQDVEIQNKEHWNKKYPFKEMKIGDSILIEGSYNDVKKAISSAHSFASKNKKKFRCVRTFGDGEDNVRIHRVS